MKQLSKPFPQNLALPAQKALASQGIAILNDLSKFYKKEIKNLPGIGPHAFNNISRQMEVENIVFRRF
jgi:hypothetical protein